MLLLVGGGGTMASCGGRWLAQGAVICEQSALASFSEGLEMAGHMIGGQQLLVVDCEWLSTKIKEWLVKLRWCQSLIQLLQ